MGTSRLGRKHCLFFVRFLSHLYKNEETAYEFMSAGLETCRLGDFNCLQHTKNILSEKTTNHVNVCWFGNLPTNGMSTRMA